MSAEHPIGGAAVDGATGGDALRSALGRFATGVTVITCRDGDGVLVGLTANSFNSVSLDPPLVLWSLSKRAKSLEAFRTATHFGVNVLAWDQVEIAQRFSSRIPDRFAGIAFHEGEGGVPLLDVSYVDLTQLRARDLEFLRVGDLVQKMRLLRDIPRAEQ